MTSARMVRFYPSPPPSPTINPPLCLSIQIFVIFFANPNANHHLPLLLLLPSPTPSHPPPHPPSPHPSPPLNVSTTLRVRRFLFESCTHNQRCLKRCLKEKEEAPPVQYFIGIYIYKQTNKCIIESPSDHGGYKNIKSLASLWGP